MYIIPIAWLYVAVMMAVAEGASSNGSILGAVITLLLYGVLPVALMVYLMGSGSRRRRIQAQERSVVGVEPDAGGHAPAATEDAAVTPVRKEP